MVFVSDLNTVVSDSISDSVIFQILVISHTVKSLFTKEPQVLHKSRQLPRKSSMAIYPPNFKFKINAKLSSIDSYINEFVLPS